MLNLENYTRTSTFVPLLNSNTWDRWGINSGRMMQEPPRKYTKNCLSGDPRPDGKTMYRMTQGRWELLIGDK
jgi:hypothetical protein